MPGDPRDVYSYQSGFGNEFHSEALPDAIPKDQNSPQTCPYGLYAEQLSGTAFTIPRTHNERTWLYRILPSVTHVPFVKASKPKDLVSTFSALDSDPNCAVTPNQLRWSPFDVPGKAPEAGPITWIQGLKTLCGAGDPVTKNGLAVHIFLANANMDKQAFYNSDGDFLIVPQQGALDVKTEFGNLFVAPQEFVVIPRGIRFSVNLPDGPSRGYVLEIFDKHFELPDLGLIGSNGCANPRHFMYPTARFEDSSVRHEIINKYMGSYFVTTQAHSPFDVVGWAGNYAPYKYDLHKFMPVSAVRFDHADPSIFTVLTCKSANPGVAIVDFVVFPPRWAVEEHTFRPPYFHRNAMSEMMGLICGSYVAKKEGFCPGGASLHSMMTPHGPDAATCEAASVKELVPERLTDASMAFMIESSYMLVATKWAMQDTGKLQTNYYTCWENIKRNFDRKWVLSKE